MLGTRKELGIELIDYLACPVFQEPQKQTAFLDESNSDKGWPLLCFDDDDFLTAQDRQKLYSSSWKLSHQASCTGIRLKGPLYKWARKDGDEGVFRLSNVPAYGVDFEVPKGVTEFLTPIRVILGETLPPDGQEASWM
ncbi:uncharacterized protein UTRI_03657 [Ustilago trichophora]|uniref:Uncharacterized protein n=1 Tax=Ustilago trichophora TaxID=86804 RepID=A0A5C3E4L7_9BASI|nr:uncharacterized protein UTRI_03657 [Ustilago trichophora]